MKHRSLMTSLKKLSQQTTSKITGFIFLSLITLLGGRAGSALALDPSISPITGLFATIFWHETGHALTAKATGYEVLSFQPYPSFCGPSFRPGCVIVGGRKSKGITPFLKNRSADTLVSVMGTGFSVLGVLIAAPMLPDIQNDHNRNMFMTIIDLQTAEWPFYVLSDLLGYGGDWGHIAQNTGIHLAFFSLPAVGAYLALKAYAKPYQDEALKKYEPEKWAEEVKSRAQEIKLPIVEWLSSPNLKAFGGLTLMPSPPTSSINLPQISTTLSLASRF